MSDFNGTLRFFPRLLSGFSAQALISLKHGSLRQVPKTLEERHRVFLMKEQLVDELIAEAMIDGKRDIQVESQAKIMDLAVRQQLLDFPSVGEIVVRL